MGFFVYKYFIAFLSIDKSNMLHRYKNFKVERKYQRKLLNALTATSRTMLWIVTSFSNMEASSQSMNIDQLIKAYDEKLSKKYKKY